MNRTDLDAYICSVFGCRAEHLWEKYPHFAVYRQQDSGKWFAVIMNIAKAKLGLPDEGRMDIVNLKCDPLLLGSLIDGKSFFPAYHMNKKNWISVVLDENTDNDTLMFLLQSSYNAVRKKKK